MAARIFLWLITTAVLLATAPGCHRRADPARVVGQESADELSSILGAVNQTAPGMGPVDAAPTAPATALRVHVTGAVMRPGVYTLPRDARVQDAIQAAGGPTPTADLEAINLAYFLKDGEQVRVPVHRRSARGDLPSLPDSTTASAATAPEPPPLPPEVGGVFAERVPSLGTTGSAPAARHAASGGLVNINTADAAELDTLPGIGPVLAGRIIDYRRQYGPFQRPEDLILVKGIGSKTFEKMKDRVTVR
ncbi:MAG: ComEA family DNA-binding protein [Armatimonadetes bacterium]|nr:ComEA family DNA-binding protein [Armatimonadota bacterium]